MQKNRSLAGKTALVTGGTGGIGYYTARELADSGARVFITGRDAKRGQAAAAEIKAATENLEVHFVQADASTVGGNQALAQELRERVERLHILVNNVGGLYNDRWETDDGYEASLAMNLVGPFTLTGALLPLMRNGDLPRGIEARIVNVTSAGFSMWKGDLFADLHSERDFSGMQAYNRSKYLNLLWTLALARRLKGSGVIANALHPGTAWTAMTQNNKPQLLPSGMRWLWPIFRLVQRSGSAEKCAQTSVFLARAPEAALYSGQYFERPPRPKSLPSEVIDEVIQERAWLAAQEMVRCAPTAISNGGQR